MNIVINNDVWCELVVEENVCKYKFLTLNIPLEAGGYKKSGDAYWDEYNEKTRRNWPPEVIEGVVFCDSNEDAKQCAVFVEKLLRSGYGDLQMQYGSWLVGMDMGDFFMQFNGEPMRFLKKTFEHSFDEESLMQIQQKIKDATQVLHYFLLPEKDEYNGDLSEVGEVYEKILPDADALVLWQLSIPNDCKRTVCVWYR